MTKCGITKTYKSVCRDHSAAWKCTCGTRQATSRPICRSDVETRWTSRHSKSLSLPQYNGSPRHKPSSLPDQQNFSPAESPASCRLRLGNSTIPSTTSPIRTLHQVPPQILRPCTIPPPRLCGQHILSPCCPEDRLGELTSDTTSGHLKKSLHIETLSRRCMALKRIRR